MTSYFKVGLILLPIRLAPPPPWRLGVCKANLMGYLKFPLLKTLDSIYDIIFQVGGGGRGGVVEQI